MDDAANQVEPAQQNIRRNDTRATIQDVYFIEHVKLEPECDEEIHGHRARSNGRGMFNGIKHRPRSRKHEICRLKHDLEIDIGYYIAVKLHRVFDHVIIRGVQET